MDLNLHGRTAFVSGSTAGIGLAIAAGLAGAGAQVIVNGRTQARVDRALEVIRAGAPGANVHGIAADLATAAGADAVVAAHPHVDVLARGLAETLAGTGVTVNSVLPGPTRSEGVGTFVRRMAEQQNVSEAEMEKQFFRTARPTSLLRRFITPEEVANLVVYVCSPAASATTGSALRVDGGVVRAIP